MRLTMGGEPTFVSIDDYETAEWNTAALGPTKRGLADQLIRRLSDKFAPGGLLHHGQGKWYPGEPLPRWAFSLFWREDGKPIWQNAALIAPEKSRRQGLRSTRRIGSPRTLPSRLGITTEHVLPAFEDPAERMLKEGALPPNIDPGDPKIDDPAERARIMREFERHLSAPTGYVLPVQRWGAQAERRLDQRNLADCAAAGCSWCRAIRRSASGCRSVRCRISSRSTSRISCPRTPSPSAARCPIPRRWPRTRGAGQAAAAAMPRRDAIQPEAAHASASPVHAETHSGSHRARGRAARRPALRVHAAGREARGLSGASRRGRSDRGRARTCRSTSKAIRRRTIRG